MEQEMDGCQGWTTGRGLNHRLIGWNASSGDLSLAGRGIRHQAATSGD